MNQPTIIVTAYLAANAVTEEDLIDPFIVCDKQYVYYEYIFSRDYRTDMILADTTLTEPMTGIVFVAHVDVNNARPIFCVTMIDACSREIVWKEPTNDIRRTWIEARDAIRGTYQMARIILAFPEVCEDVGWMMAGMLF